MTTIPEKISMSDPDRTVGKYVILFRNEVKVVGKVLGVDKARHHIVHEMIGGPDRGKKFESNYDENQWAWYYTWENLNLALLES